MGSSEYPAARAAFLAMLRTSSAVMRVGKVGCGDGRPRSHRIGTQADRKAIPSRTDILATG